MATNYSNGGATALPTALIAQAVPMLSRHELAPGGDGIVTIEAGP